MTAEEIKMESTFSALFEQNQSIHADFSQIQTLGCSNVKHIGLDELRIMGYDNLISDASLRYDRADSSQSMTWEFQLNTKDVHQLNVKLNIVQLGEIAPEKRLVLDQIALQGLSVYYRTSNFSKKFLQFCASHRNVREKTIIDEKLTLLKSKLNKQGILISDALWQGYAQILAKTSDINLLIEPKEKFDLANVKLYSPKDIIEWLAPTLWINQQPINPISVSWNRLADIQPYKPQASRNEQQQEKPQATLSTIQKAIPHRAHFRAVIFTDLKYHVGRQVKVTTKRGEVHAGTIERIQSDEAWINKRMYGGNMSIPVRRGEIRKLEVYF